MITDSSLVEKWETVERAMRYVCKNLLNLDCQDSICFAFFKFFKNEESFGKSFSFPFSANCLDRNFKCLFKNVLNFLSCTLPFLNVRNLKIQNILKDLFSIVFSNNNYQRRNMYFEDLFIGLCSIG